MRSAGSLASTRVHHPDSFKADKPDRKISPLQCDRVPEMVPSHVFLFFLDIKSNEKIFLKKINLRLNDQGLDVGESEYHELCDSKQ